VTISGLVGPNDTFLNGVFDATFIGEGAFNCDYLFTSSYPPNPLQTLYVPVFQGTTKWGMGVSLVGFPLQTIFVIEQLLGVNPCEGDKTAGVADVIFLQPGYNVSALVVTVEFI